MESILGLEQKRSSLRRTAETIIDKALREGRALRPGEEADVRAIQGKIEDCNRTFSHLAQISTGRDHGATFIRMIRTLADKRGNITAAREFARGTTR